MAFGSINIFRYLWLKEVKYSKETLKYCIIGGNFEILHVLEEESQYKFDKGSYFQSIEYYHPEMTEYFFYSYVSKEISKLQFPLIMTKFNQTTNIEIVCELFLNKSVTQVSQHEKYFSSSKKYTLTFNANKVLDSILNSQQSPFYFLYCFLLQQPNIDINSKHKILIFNFIIYYFLNGISN
ncbi:hypothetical protein TRFO_32562 [Tritrichomonas foetus]|uniref:DUF3447 domain-containing protein n=1 Tax=Tritrichomonas foetus TaxID=1144522 RepID=A0A1J4JPN5_9EUKA|nr:hypothetical protein TRFO_32562 [Tritrichomonas foetus]|eukprot:OHT00698.1 hypothetical protein TRFO_32562 [Tritrichomonas foetus]